jgi:hypothetical protein
LVQFQVWEPIKLKIKRGNDKMFIELTSWKDATKQNININHILMFIPYDDGCLIDMGEGSLKVKESYETVKNMIGFLCRRG